ncbi:DUF4287 domain-containing protein [Leucobacter sp. cx-328]|uniref:DUF4287 domain-containing protein n=1 Tax=unclassified Leucobacter TaxID=2621730 RepID=UPI00165DB256|nr:MULTISPECIES: DUF4287 domain-containing protein [unclassified Leucobacter]MBC9943128.1 DUF4287 domain-containing protein [Leucobacter sp. cx-328]
MAAAENTADSAPAAKGPKSYFPSIETKYGKPMTEWFAMLAPHTGEKHMAQVAALKAAGMGHGHANAVVHVFRAEHGGAGE